MGSAGRRGVEALPEVQASILEPFEEEAQGGLAKRVRSLLRVSKTALDEEGESRPYPRNSGALTEDLADSSRELNCYRK